MQLKRYDTLSEFEKDTNIAVLAERIHQMLKPFEDTVDQIKTGLNDALTGKGMVTLSYSDDGSTVQAVCVMMKTGMEAYIPENLLLYVAVDASLRGQGIGRKILTESFAACEGDIKLHVEHDNPAVRLYERLGFTSKYKEMRLERG